MQWRKLAHLLYSANPDQATVTNTMSMLLQRCHSVSRHTAKIENSTIMWVSPAWLVLL
jgi:hypothetical protein